MRVMVSLIRSPLSNAQTRGARAHVILFVLAAALVLSSAPAGRASTGRGAGPEIPQNRAAQHVLFIGNSLTGANDLPGLVEALANATKGPRIQCRAVLL